MSMDTFRADVKALLEGKEETTVPAPTEDPEATIWKELSEGYGKLLKTLQTTTSVIEASTAVLTQYERPADMGGGCPGKESWLRPDLL